MSIEINKFIVASDKPNNLKFTSLQLGELAFKDFMISVLSIRSMFALAVSYTHLTLPTKA